LRKATRQVEKWKSGKVEEWKVEAAQKWTSTNV
jgi:hypothetical protein